MTVREMIRLLSAYPDDLRVVVNGYEEGFDDLSQDSLKVVKIALNTGTQSWVGIHGDPMDYKGSEAQESPEVVDALVLWRSSV